MGERVEPEIRILESEAELGEAAALFRTAMVALPSWWELPEGAASRFLEPGRTWGSFLDGMLVGTVDATSGRLTLPGGARIPHAAVTHVGVLPTHTRRGVVSGLVRRQLSDARDRGELVATLRASEATIYGRFGYGVASTSVSVEVDVRRAALRPDVPESGPVRLLTRPDKWEVLAEIHSRHLPSRPGTIDRSGYWWNSQRRRADSITEPMYVVVHGEPGQENGFACYRPLDAQRWFTGRTVAVDDFFAPSPEAHAGLLRFLLDLDLVEKLRFAALPEDDTLALLLRDPRAAEIRSVSDETWLRILDLERALAARTWRGSGSVGVEVTDSLFRDNSGTFEISPDGVRRCSAGAEADLSVDVADLGALLLGGVSWQRMAAAGRVRVHRPEAVDTADLLFSWPCVPFAGTSF